MDVDFYDIARSAHYDKCRSRIRTVDDDAKIQYRIFCNWCRCNNLIPGEHIFRKYLKSGDPFANIKSYTIKRIYELFFGYKLIWNGQKQKWEGTKN